MKTLKAQAQCVCSICAANQGYMTRYLDGHVCESCCEKTRQGRDGTTQALKLKQKVGRLQVEQLKGCTNHESVEAIEYTIAAGHLMADEFSDAKTQVQIGSGGEVIKAEAAGMINTLSQPSIAAVEASNHRTDLVSMLGSDVAAMALDAADTIKAANSLEKMLAHQMAAIHQASMQFLNRANLIQDPTLAAKTLNSAMKGFSAYQGAIGALRQLRGNQQQHIVVQHVNVSAGGQAMVGTVNARGGNS